MELVAAPLIVSVSRLARNTEFSQVPAFVVDRLRTPRTIHKRITKRAAVRRADFPPVVHLWIGVCMALRTRSECARGRTKPRAFVLRMTIDTPDPRSFVRLDHRSHKRVRVVACRATPSSLNSHPSSLIAFALHEPFTTG